MKEELVTLAIHTYDRAVILKSLLESQGIEAYIQNVNIIIPQSSEGVRVRIKKSDLDKALEIVESSSFKDGKLISDAKTKRKVILIPVDFSSYSLKACKIGFHIAEKTGAEAIIAHIYYVPFYPAVLVMPDSPIIVQEGLDIDVKEALQHAEKGMRTLKKEIKALQKNGELPDIKYTAEIREGIPEETIVKLGKEFDPLLIVMGTRGMGKRETNILGSVTVDVIEQSRCRVLAIPEDAPTRDWNNIRHVAFATNFDERALTAFDGLVKLMGKNINYTIVHFKEKKRNLKEETQLERFGKFLEMNYPDLQIKHRMIQTEDLLSDLNRFLETDSVDLLSITSHKRNPFIRLLYSSFVSKMLLSSKIPVLVVRT